VLLTPLRAILRATFKRRSGTGGHLGRPEILLDGLND
jgi:hypothetical protein